MRRGLTARSRAAFAVAVLCSSLLVVGAMEARAAAEEPGASVEVFVRKAGSPPAWRFVQKDGARSFELDKLPLQNVKHGDVQYEAKLDLRGISVAALLAEYKPPMTVDLAILHFANGMAVPLPFRDDAVMKRLDPFIARGLVDAKGTLSPLPPIARKVESYVDVKPISFAGNKLAVKARFHPEVGEDNSALFSPWSFTDTLLSIELVSQGPYYRQFAVSDEGDAPAGLVVFRQACQSCHGVHKLGAGFGWDFAEPEPIVARTKLGRLLFHVKYRATSEVLRGAQMPALSFLSEDAATRLYGWLKAIADKPLRPYEP